MLGMLFATLIDGAVVLETVFNLPGIGLLMVDSVIARDPGMVLGLVLSIGIFMMIWILLILSRIVGWMPPIIHSSVFDNPVDAFQRYLFPSLILGFRSAAVISRMVRSMMLEVLSEDYVRTAWAKGLQPRSVIIGHALRNALLPVVTMLGMLFATLIDGAVVLETVFNLPGIGLLMVDSVIARDPGMVLGLVLSIGIFMMIWILLIDLSYKVLDPRVEYD